MLGFLAPVAAVSRAEGKDERPGLMRREVDVPDGGRSEMEVQMAEVGVHVEEHKGKDIFECETYTTWQQCEGHLTFHCVWIEQLNACKMFTPDGMDCKTFPDAGSCPRYCIWNDADGCQAHTLPGHKCSEFKTPGACPSYCNWFTDGGCQAHTPKGMDCSLAQFQTSGTCPDYCIWFSKKKECHEYTEENEALEKASLEEQEAEEEEDDQEVAAVDLSKQELSKQDVAFHSLLIAMPLVIQNVSHYSGRFSMKDGGPSATGTSHEFGKDAASDEKLLLDNVEGFLTLMQEQVLDSADTDCPSGSVRALDGCLSKAMCFLQEYVDSGGAPDKKDIQKFALLEELFTRFQDMTWPQTMSLLGDEESTDSLIQVPYWTPEQHSCEAYKPADAALLETSADRTAALATSEALVSTTEKTHAILDKHGSNSSVAETIQQLHATWKPVCEQLSCDGTNYRDLYRASHALSTVLMELGASASHMRVHIRTRQRLEMRWQQFLGAHGQHFGPKVDRVEEETTWKSAIKHYVSQSRSALLEHFIDFGNKHGVSTSVYPFRVLDGKQMEQAFIEQDAADALDILRSHDMALSGQEDEDEAEGDDADEQALNLIEAESKADLQAESESAGRRRRGRRPRPRPARRRAPRRRRRDPPRRRRRRRRNRRRRRDRRRRSRRRRRRRRDRRRRNRRRRRDFWENAAGKASATWNNFNHYYNKAVNEAKKQISDMKKTSAGQVINDLAKEGSKFGGKFTTNAFVAAWKNRVNMANMANDWANDIAKVHQAYQNAVVNAQERFANFLLSTFACLGSTAEGYAYGYAIKGFSDTAVKGFSIAFGITVGGVGPLQGITDLLNGKDAGVSLNIAISLCIGFVPGGAEFGGARVGIGLSAGLSCGSGAVNPKGGPDCRAYLTLGGMASGIFPTTGCIGGVMQIGPFKCFFAYSVTVSVMCCTYYMISGMGECR